MIRALGVGVIVGAGTTAIVLLVDAPMAVWLAAAMLLGLVWLAICAVALGPSPGLGGEWR